ncbi:MAG: aryl-sulfate sulfotransferase [Bacteroidota bacterium]|nr:aryl-sulfate sulfotransferase [Bacteroidota bacterium]
MRKIFMILICYPLIGLSQVNYTITVNTNDAWHGNLFFQRGGPPQKPVKIVDSSGLEIFSENWGMKGWDFKVNYNNKLSYFDRSSKGWFIMDSLHNEIDSVYAQNGYVADNHDFLALPNGNYVLFCYDDQPYAMDTIVPGGDPNAIIEGLIIQELDSNHNVIFEWKSWDHFHITDNIYLDLTSASLPFIHTNAIDIDFDGNFIFSNRNLDEITKIHRTTGEIIWRWGGSQNEFNFINDYPFTHQHSIRSLGENKYLLYDNGNHSDQYIGVNLSRAVEYQLDTVLMTATKVWEFVHPDSLYTPSISSVQRLPNGNTLIDFGNLQWLNLGSIVTEVDQNNQIVFQLEYDNGGNLYRAQKFDWFFYTPPNYSWDCLAGSCVDPGTGLGLFTDSLQCVLNCSSTDISNLVGVKTAKLIKIIDLLGKETSCQRKKILFYVYDDGTVEKRIIVN